MSPRGRLQPRSFLHVSDLHLEAGGERRLEQWIDAIDRRLRQAAVEPAFIVITGDVAQTGGSDEYQLLADAVAGFDVPAVAVPGNHDSLPALTASGIPTLAPGEAHIGGIRLLGLDTTVPGQDHGALSPSQHAWLHERLAGAGRGEPTVVALHQPPVPVGLAEIDALGLQDAERFWSTLKAAGPPGIVVCGHVHRPAIRSVDGIPVVTAASLAWRSEADIRPGAPLRDSGEAMSAWLHVWLDPGFASHLLILD